MNDTLIAIKNRRSTRVYTQEMIQEEELNSILESGMYAPSAGNQQPWHFTVIDNQDVLQRMNEATKDSFKKSSNEQFKKIAGSEKFNVFHNAPIAIIISGDKNAMLPRVDCAAATENMLIAAESLNIGSCWVQAAIHLFDGDNSDNWKKQLKIPEGYQPLYAIILGYKGKDDQKAPPRKTRLLI
ncbi:MAG: nitroreductase family protein [Firmicutes bacterium]|nr:nitroreductase family protein [Bacillota bacterium]